MLKKVILFSVILNGGVVVSSLPIMEVMGGDNQDVLIANGDTSPSLTDGTDFGQANINEDKIRVFRIWNTAEAVVNLHITSVNLPQPEFSLFNPPPYEIEPDDYVDMQVDFFSENIGTYAGNLVIHSQELSNYVFAITIEAVEA